MVNKDRIVGSAKIIEGKAKASVGSISGDTKLQAEGQVEIIEGKVQKAVGNLKETIAKN